MFARQERETGKLTFQLQPNAKTVSVPKDKPVDAMTPAAPKKIRIARISACSGLEEHAGDTEYQYAIGSPAVVGKLHPPELPMRIDG